MCTVALGTPDGDGMRYEAVNACILFVPALDGKQLVTVEHLRAAEGALHPVQQAMVEQHGSQCGFCTPGFVMSLFALYHAGTAPGRGAIDEALAGNLCRCTGYRPIVDAARQSCVGAAADGFAAAAAETAGRLSALQSSQTLALEFEGRHFFAPGDVAALAALMIAHPDAVVLAGGTDVGLWVTKQHRSLGVVISLEAVAELRAITRADAMIRIGARATYEDALGVIAEAYPDFGRLVRRIGSRQIRNRGTIGGNVANGSPIGDSMPVLIALGARVVLRRGDAQREMALEDFYLGYRKTALAPGEFVERVDLPWPSAEMRFACYKVSKRSDQDISAVCAAFRLTLRDGHVEELRTGFGGMSATPARALAVEQALAGQVWGEAAVRAGMEAMDAAFSPLSDMRSSARYRRVVARNLLWKFYLEISGADQTRLEAVA